MSPTPLEISNAFLQKIQTSLAAKDIPGISQCFRSDGWWRDILAVTFDFNSIKGPDVPEFLQKFGVPDIEKLVVIDEAKCKLEVINAEVTWISAFISFETSVGRGKGFVRLRESSEGAGDWLAYTFFTNLWEIKGAEEFAYDRRPLGTIHGESEDSRKNWLDRRQEKVKFETEDPTVLILGGGQNGLMLAARLTTLGIQTLVIEKNKRVGDSWRNRYHTLVLHDPIYADHFPYLQYPPHFPKYIPKDKLANWFEHYAEVMELNVWLNSTIEPNPVYDDKTATWSVNVIKDGTIRNLRVAHLVLATGFSGEARLPAFAKNSEFQGTVVHSSQHKGAAEWKGKNAVVIGCCNSGHDIAADFYESKSNTTIVQRSSTYVMSSEHGVPGLLDGYYQEGGPATHDADIMLTSLPVELLKEYHIEAGKAIAIKDKVLLDGLTKAGFKLNPYPGSLFLKYFRDGGGYYIDVGCSQLIIDGKVKIKQGQEIAKLTKTGVLFADGVELPADIVVCATGYSSMRDTVRRIVSSDVADRLNTVWGADAQGEIPSAWRNTGVPGFWLQPGNFFQARCFSKHVALQIQMIELGLAKKTTDYPQYKEVHDPRF